MDIRNLGNFASIQAVWQTHPNGGIEGDYLFIPNEQGVKYRWNKYIRQWENAAVVTETPGRQSFTVSDLQVQNEVHVASHADVQGDLRVQGVLRAAHVKQPNVGLFATLTALQAAYPSPEVGMWATVGDSVPGYIYRCNTAGTWEATGETGGVDDLENVVLYGEQSLTDAQKKQARQNLGFGNGDFATGSDFDNPDSTKRAKIPTVGAIVDGLDADGAYDVTARSGGTTFDSLDDLLGSESLGTLIPVAKRRGGMSIKFVLTESNTYVQCRYMLPYNNTTAGNKAFKNVKNWQGVDDEPTAGSDNLVKSGGVNSLINNTFNEFAIISNKDPEYNKATQTFTLPKLTNIQAQNKIITCNSSVIFSYSEINDGYSTHFLILNINTLEKRYIRANNNAVVLNENEALIALLRWDAGVLKGNFFSYYSNGEKITKLFSESIFADNVIVPTTKKIGVAFYYENNDKNYQKLPLTIPAGNTVKIKLISLVTSEEATNAGFYGKTYKDDDNYVSLQSINIGEEKSTEINIDIKYLKIAASGTLSSYKVLISFGGFEFESLTSDVSELKSDVSELKSDVSVNESYNNENFTDGNFYLLTQGVGGTAPDILSHANGWACLKIEVHAGQTTNLKTIGGSNARAYALTDVNRTILSVAPKNADYSSGIALTVEQDGYLYVNTSTEFLPNVSVVISGGSKTRIDILEDDVSEIKDDVESLKDKEEVISYNSSDLESGFFSFPMTTANPYAYGSKDTSWKRLVLPIYKGDELKISTVGGSSARAYGLANTEYIITSIADSGATIDNQTLNITEDGYIYLNCNINNVDNFSVVIHRKSQTNKSIVAKAFNPPVNLTKGNIRILDIGNSYTNNATKYLPDIINAAGVVSDYSLYKAIRGSGSFRTWVNCYNDADGNNYSITKVAGNTISEVTEGISAANDGSLFRSALAAGWDIILIHQVSTYSNNFDMWEHPNSVSPASSLKEFIGILRKTNPNACIGFLMVHSYNANYTDNSEGSSLGRWQNIVKCTKEFTTKYGIDLIIPYGTAVQNLRASSLNDDNEFCSDGSHLADGIGCYVASCCYYQSIFAPRTGISILGNTFRKTDLNETSPGVKNINDTNAALAQKAAFAACYDRYDVKNPDLIPDVSNFITASVGSLVDYYTKSETYTKAEVDALIAELRAELAANNNNE